MPDTVISVENLSKAYQLGAIGTGTFYGDLNRWWAKLRGLPDPHLKIGEKDHGNRDGETVWALWDINFTVQQGETVGIIGRNGAGKSTLLKILSRVTAPTSGEVKTKGRIASLLEVGTGFHPELTGRENVFLNGAILGMSRHEILRKFDEIVDFSGVEKYIDTPVKRYSSGMYVRLAFAVAAHLEPEILIVDEVLAVGDAEFQKKCLGKMSDVASEGRTVLFVSHNMVSIQQLCEKAIVIDKGKIVFEGSQSDAIDSYLQGLSQSHHISQRDRTDRFGTGIIKITGVDICNSKHEFVDAISSGDPIEIHFHYEAENELDGKDVNLGILCSTIMGVRVFTVSMRYTNQQSKMKLQKTGTIIYRLNSLPLVSGLYNFRTILRVRDERADVLENAFSLSVLDRGMHGTTQERTQQDGVIILKGDWRLQQ